MEAYRDAKGLLFSQLGNVYGEQNPKYAVFNADDETYERYKEMTAARVITYGIDHEADFRATNITHDSKGNLF